MTTARNHRHVGVRAVFSAALGAALALTVASCQASGDVTPRAKGKLGHPTQPVPSTTPRPDPAPRLVLSFGHHATDVAVDTVVTVGAADGNLTAVRLRPARGGEPLPGSMVKRGTTWRATDLLEPDMTYRINATVVDTSGRITDKKTQFRTAALTLDEQTYPRFTPGDGATVGVGMPAIVQFDVPVTDRASIERHLQVTSTPQVRGSWHWVSDTEVHWRPQHLWPMGTAVQVAANINGVDAGNGIYGQLDRSSSFTVGDEVISKVNVATHRMRVYLNGALARTIPVTAGKRGFETRSGTKVIVEKVLLKHMDAATIGIEPGDPEYYDIPDVHFAMRVTYSGEFLHAAPWSVADQGVSNVSHGCVGMSLSNAKWLFKHSQVGDVVRVSGTDRLLEEGNGWTDWNVSFQQYKAGSALS